MENNQFYKTDRTYSGSIDLMFVDNQTVWFLQFNPYGVYAASRSALFTHEEILQLEKQVGLPVIKIVQN